MFILRTTISKLSFYFWKFSYWREGHKFSRSNRLTVPIDATGHLVKLRLYSLLTSVKFRKFIFVLKFNSCSGACIVLVFMILLMPNLRIKIKYYINFMQMQRLGFLFFEIKACHVLLEVGFCVSISCYFL